MRYVISRKNEHSVNSRVVEGLSIENKINLDNLESCLKFKKNCEKSKEKIRDKLKKFKIVDASTRNTKAYKEKSEGKLCLLQSEVNNIKLMIDKINQTKICEDLIRGDGIDYEVPNIVELEGNMWKGKADVVNHKEDLVIDLKTTADISKFRSSAFRYNYDSQAFIYKELFGYDFIFMVIDKTTKQIGIFECSEEFLNSGYIKVKKACEIYDLFFKDKDFDPDQYFISETL